MRIATIGLTVCMLPLGGETLDTDYTHEATLRIECSTSFTVETIEFSIERDGEPMRTRGGSGAGGLELSRTVVHLDRVLDNDDGVPTELERSFETVSGNDVASEQEHSVDSPLEGVTLRLVLDDGEVVAEALDGSVEDEQLQGHTLTLTLDALLPDDDVEPGDSWEIDGQALLHVLGQDLEEVLFPMPEHETGGGGGRDERRARWMSGRRRNPFTRLARTADWEVTATLADETEEVEGLECLVIEFEAEASGTLEDEMRMAGGRERSLAPPATSLASFETDFLIDLKGTLYFAQELRRPVQLAVEGTFDMDMESSFDREGVTMTIRRVQEGTFEQSVTISEE